MQGEIATTPSLNLTLEQKHVIKELIKDMKMEPAVMLRAGVGDVVPQGVDLKSVPSELAGKVPQIKAHKLLHAAERILIIDPKNNKVADIIELKAE